MDRVSKHLHRAVATALPADVPSTAGVSQEEQCRTNSDDVPQRYAAPGCCCAVTHATPLTHQPVSRQRKRRRRQTTCDPFIHFFPQWVMTCQAVTKVQQTHLHFTMFVASILPPSHPHLRHIANGHVPEIRRSAEQLSRAGPSACSRRERGRRVSTTKRVLQRPVSDEKNTQRAREHFRAWLRLDPRRHQ